MSPSLTPEQRRALLGPVAGLTCQGCGEVMVRHYCRSCDEVFLTCRCHPGQHDDHRVYLWTPAGIIARPDFDAIG